MNPEGWYDIPGYGGKYQINFYGRIRREFKNGKYKELHPFIKKSNGRRCIKLNCKEQVVMKLMQRTFFGELKDGYVVYHKNGCLTDDALNNIGITTRAELGKLTGRKNHCECKIVKLDNTGEIIDFYRSAREAGRKNHMSYQTILDRINGRVKGLYAPDGYVYVKDKDGAIQKAIRRIELENRRETGVTFTAAPDVVFDF